MEDETDQEQLAYFRFGVISPLLADELDRTLKQRLSEQAERLWVFPDGKLKRIGYGTIEHWLYDYRRYGIDALRSHQRSDAGSFRGIDEQLANAIDSVLADHPELRTHAIIDHIRREELLGESPPSQSTLYRYIKANRIAEPPTNTQERRSFEAPYAGYLWQADIMYGPHLPKRMPNGRTRKHQTFLIAIIDDHSRLLCHGQFFFTQDLATWLSCLESAIRKRGIPKKLYCDNGKVFTAMQVKKIAARLGIEIRHTKVRDAAAKGKIEKMFQRCRHSFLEPFLAIKKPQSIEQLNTAFVQWSEREYNHAVHSAFDDTPIRRFMETASHMRPLPENDVALFHVRCNRTVKKDGTFSLNGDRYETDPALVGCRITVSYDLQKPRSPYVFWKDRSYGKASLLDPKANCNRRRRNG